LIFAFRETPIMMLHFVAATLWLAAGQDAAIVSTASSSPSASIADGRDAGLLLYDEMRQRIARQLPPRMPARRLDPLLGPDHLEPGADPVTRMAVELQRAQLRLVELEVVATRENPELAALEDRIEILSEELKRLRRQREYPNRSLLARNREQLLDHLEANLAAAQENETKAHPLKKVQRRLASEYSRLMR
jgi:hypothetical protein